MFLDKDAVIFDLDGTLIDSLGIWSLVDQLLVEELSRDHVKLTEEEAYQLRAEALGRYGEGSAAYVAYCGDLKEKFGMPGTAETIHHRRYEIATEALATHVRWREGAADLFKALKAAGLRLAIATTTRRRNIDVYAHKNEGMIREAAIEEIFEVVKTRDEVERVKSDPQVHQLIMAEMGLTPERCIIVEDATAGLKAAKAAGIEAVVVTERHSEVDRAVNDALAIRRFETLGEILEVVRAEAAAELRPASSVKA